MILITVIVLPILIFVVLNSLLKRERRKNLEAGRPNLEHIGMVARYEWTVAKVNTEEAKANSRHAVLTAYVQNKKK